MVYDLLIVGGGASGVSCALVVGSGMKKPFAKDKKVAIIPHQRASSLQDAIFNNVYGIAPGTLGTTLMANSMEQLARLYPEVEILPTKKIHQIEFLPDKYRLSTLQEEVFEAKIVVLAIGAGNPISIQGLEAYVRPHGKTPEEKNRIQLRNHDHMVREGLYVCGTLAGHRSQLAIASGSGAAVATDILTLWNHGKHVQVHDRDRNKPKQ
jgi:thioredoxin reductase